MGAGPRLGAVACLTVDVCAASGQEGRGKEASRARMMWGSRRRTRDEGRDRVTRWRRLGGTGSSMGGRRLGAWVRDDDVGGTGSIVGVAMCGGRRPTGGPSLQ